MKKELRHLLRHLVIGDVVPYRLLPQETLTAVFWYTTQHQIPPPLFIHLWDTQHKT